MELPALFEKRIHQDFPDKARDILEGILSGKKEDTFRLNSEKLTLEDLEHLIPDSTRRAISLKDGIFSTEKKELYSKNPLIFGGIYYFQSLSSTLPVRILNPQLGDGVLDACASPGSKSTQILGHLKGSGFLVANEVDKTRIGRLVQNISEWGAKNIWICQKDTQNFSSMTEFFDKILVDAPCSGEGMFYKNHRIGELWNPQKVSQSAQVQKYILKNLLPTLKVGGELVYSTCTLSLEENEEIVDWILEQYGDFVELIPFSDLWEGGEPGVTISKSRFGKEISEKTRRVFPYHQDFSGEAFFLAKFRVHHSFPTGSPQRSSKRNYPEILRISPKILRSFWEDMKLMSRMDEKSLLMLGHSLFYHPRWTKDFIYFMLSCLHPIYAGCRLGTVKDKWIFPTYEWVLQRELLSPEVLVDLDEEKIELYLLGTPQAIETKEREGFVAVSYKNIPLGMGKILKEKVLRSYFSPIAGKKIISL